MPCHVSRDGGIPQRCEARATAAAMWATRGIGSHDSVAGEQPVPLAVKQMVEEAIAPAVPRNWGTSEPFAAQDNDAPFSGLPFRPAVASAFLYTPLLCWDLCTFAGAVFSTVLANEVKELPSSDELLHLARTLVTARIVQSIITPGGMELPDEMDLDDEDCWTAEEVQTQGTALARLVAHCRMLVSTKSLNAWTGLDG